MLGVLVQHSSTAVLNLLGQEQCARGEHIENLCLWCLWYAKRVGGMMMMCRFGHGEECSSDFRQELAE